MSMGWFKMWTDFDIPGFKWTADIDNAELGAWVRLMRYAAIAETKGAICITEGVSYTPEQVKAMIKADKDYLEKWEKQGAIKIEKGVIFIANWKKYQSEYDRQKPYRKKNEKELQEKVTSEGYTKSYTVEVEVDKEIEQEHINTKTKTKDIARKKTSAPTIPGFSETRKFWIETYNAEYGENYPYAFGKDDGILKPLVITYGYERLKPMIKMFLDKGRKQWNNKRTIAQFKTDAEEMARATAAPQSDAEKYAPPERKWARGGGYIGD